MTGGVVIRPATEADRDAIWQILEPIVEGGAHFCAPPGGGQDGAFAYFCPETAENFVAEVGGRILGVSYLKPNQTGNGDHVCNAGYATHPDARGRGIARALLDHSLTRAKDRGFSAMQFNFVVETNTRAIETWERAGFQIVGRLPGAFRHPAEGMVDALVMWKSLDQHPSTRPQGRA